VTTTDDDWITPATPPHKPNVVDLESARKVKQSTEWKNLLRYRKEGGALTKDIGNLVLMLANSEEWAGTLTFDEFSERIYWARKPPPIAGLRTPEGEATAADAFYVHHYFARCEYVSFSKGDVYDAMEAAARHRSTHAVRDWLAALKWDGKRRVQRWLSTYLGTENNELTRAVGQWWLISAVARAYKPGCQVDHMLVLEGPQGAGKSTAMHLLFGTDWYLPKLPNVQDETRASSALRGRWGVEAGELDAFRGAAWTRVKDFLSQSHDDFRAAYARLELKRPRHCVFVGTTNDSAWNGDPTGARRFWPVKVGRIDRETLRRDREQLWAEAVALFEGGVRWWPDPGEDQAVMAQLSEAQEARYVGDEWEHRIVDWLMDGREGFTAADVLAGPIHLEPGKWDKSAQTRVGQILTRLGYERHRRREAGRLAYRYWKVGSERNDSADAEST
jgi:putative DNA primase/helicase